MSKMDHVPIVTPAFFGRGDGTAGGVQMSCDTTSKAVVLPTNGAGERPKYVRVATNGTGYFRMNSATTVATVNDWLFTSGMDAIFVVGPCTHASYVSASGTTVCNVTAIEFG